MTAVHRLSLEVGGQRPLAVRTVQEGPVSVGAEGTGQHTDVPEDTLWIAQSRQSCVQEDAGMITYLQRLVKNVGHLVLEILSSNQRVEQLATALDHGMDFTTASTEMRIVVESFPQVVDRLPAGFGTRVNQDADLRL